MGQVAREVARDELKRWMAAWDIAPEAADVDELDALSRKVETGALVVTDDGDLDYTLGWGTRKGEVLRFRVCTAAAKLAASRHTGKAGHLAMDMTAALCGQMIQQVSALDFRDSKIIDAVGALFLVQSARPSLPVVVPNPGDTSE